MKPTIADLVHEAIDARVAKGYETYGRPLEPFDGRDTGQDKLEELLDAVMYEMKARVEREAALDAVERLREWTFDMRGTDMAEFESNLETIEAALGRVR